MNRFFNLLFGPGALLVTIFVSMVSGQEKAIPSYRDFSDILTEFAAMTEIQQEDWNTTNQGKIKVSGSGEIEEVGRVGIMDTEAPKSCNYKIVVNLDAGEKQGRAVVYLKTSVGLKDLNKGDKYYFKGTLLSLKDWGLWITGYIKGE